MPGPGTHTIFLLSPAHCGGERAAMLLNQYARFDLARRIRGSEGAPVAEVFSFLSGLYFRAKFLYAVTFANPPAGAPGVLVITPGEGLRSPIEPVTADTLRRYAEVRIDLREERYRRPLLRDAAKLARRIAPRSRGYRVVLLGSIATDKYVSVLREIFGERLVFPAAFVGRGDMSRGGLLLRCVDQSRELDYVSFESAPRHGPRPPRLEKRKRT